MTDSHLPDQPRHRRGTPYLDQLSRRLAHDSGDQYDEDDLQQHMALTRLERQQSLAGQTPAYERQRLSWSAQNLARHGRRYRQSCPRDPLLLDDDGEPTPLTHLVVDPNALNPEDALIAKQDWEERQARAEQLLARLTPLLTSRQREVLTLTQKGERQSAIAARIRTSPANVSLHMRTIRRVAQKVVAHC